MNFFRHVQNPALKRFSVALDYDGLLCGVGPREKGGTITICTVSLSEGMYCYYSNGWPLKTTARPRWQGGAESSLPVAHPGYRVLLDILFRLGLIANALTQCSS